MSNQTFSIYQEHKAGPIIVQDGHRFWAIIQLPDLSYEAHTIENVTSGIVAIFSFPISKENLPKLAQKTIDSLK